MTEAIIMLAPAAVLCEAYFAKDLAALALAFLGKYEKHTVQLDGVFRGEEVAEECFELTNDPSRQEERQRLYGRHRSVSVGDVIDDGYAQWVCAPSGWLLIGEGA